jgi:hypothetical protein
MQRSYGALAVPAPSVSQMTLRFFEGPLALDWMHCGALAKYIGNHYSGLAGGHRLDPVEAGHSINYLVNELMENAVKFRAPGTVELQTSLLFGSFTLRLSNVIEPDTATKFQALLEQITSRDAGDLIIERLEANAAEPDSEGSGIGILTLISDYGVQLGWTFSSQDTGQAIRLETHAVLALV